MNYPIWHVINFNQVKCKSNGVSSIIKLIYGVKNGDLLYDREKSSGMVLDLDVDKHYVYLLYLDQLLSEYDFKKS